MQTQNFSKKNDTCCLCSYLFYNAVFNALFSTVKLLRSKDFNGRKQFLTKHV